MKRLVVCVLLVACGGDDSGDGGFVAVDDLGLEISLASCAKQFDCCTDAEIMEQYMGITFNDEPITTEEQCVDFANAFFTSFATTQHKASIEKGRIEYDGAAAAGCIAAIRGVTCAQYSAGAIDDRPISCRPFLIPKVADGGACLQDYECISDNCVGESTSIGEDPVDGACAPMPDVGQECDDNCTDGNYCDYDQTANMDICKPLEADGAQCTFDGDCESDNCESSMCTAKPLVCDGR